ncbi:Panacea domain-containing protein [Thiomicrospira sp.]|uniref:Panacea domain-containing protein n=1 Tax=Thiomicrospira sp. TaxID=935 RepID=UPI002F956FD2
MSSSLAVANKFIELARNEDNHSLTNMKLQKLVYIAHGFSLAGMDEPLLTNEDVYAWQFGPVIRDLYQSLRKYGRGEVTDFIPSSDQINDEEQQQLIKAIWEGYGHHSGFALSQITHRPNTPWSKVWNQAPYSEIPRNLIRAHYQEILDRIEA